jgi:hypothetical protein
VATAAHNIEDLPIEATDVIPSGGRGAKPIPVLDGGWQKDADVDVVWLRLDREVIPSYQRFLDIDQLRTTKAEVGLPCLDYSHSGWARDRAEL